MERRLVGDISIHACMCVFLTDGVTLPTWYVHVGHYCKTELNAV